MSILILTPNINVVNITMIDANAYHIACKLKETQVFAVSIKNLEFQAAKKS